MTTKDDRTLEKTVKGKVIYLLVLIGLVQFIYPVTAYGQTGLIFYQILYVSMMIAGMVVGHDSKQHTFFLVGAGTLYCIAGLVYALNPTAEWAIAAAYLALLPYQGMLIWVLGRFISIVQTVTRDVLYAAVALYLLLGAFFVPLYGLLNLVWPGSLNDSGAAGKQIQWQQLIYFSYTTLTSSGYGDVLPVSWWARALANLEMIAGVMFITIIMARLVALYSTERNNS